MTLFPEIRDGLEETVSGELVSTRVWNGVDGYLGKWVQIRTETGLGIFGLRHSLEPLPPLGSMVDVVLRHGRKRAFAQKLELKEYPESHLDPPLPPVAGPSLETYTEENIRRWRRMEDKLIGCLILMLRKFPERREEGFKAREVDDKFVDTYGYRLADGTAGMLLRKMSHDYEDLGRGRKRPKKPVLVRPRRGRFLPTRDMVPAHLWAFQTAD